MRKKLWLIFGPLLCAILLILLLIITMNTHPKSNYKVERKNAVALTPTVFKSEILKRQALNDKKHRFVPFFGSSEWKRMDLMHPSVLAQKYHRNYRPFLLGDRGATSLTQFYGMQQILPQMKNKKAVFVISPQWFIKRGTIPQAFALYYGSGQGLNFLKNQKGTVADRYAAKRFLKVMPESSIKPMMQKVAKGQPLSQLDHKRIHAQLSLINHEDALFSKAQPKNNYKKYIAPRLKHLPNTDDPAALHERATEVAQRRTRNNRFGVDDTFYTKKIKPKEAHLAGAQKKFDYEQSPEYNDFQLVLEQFAQSNTNVMFVIPPVNEKWAKYTKLDLNMYQKSVSKMKYQMHAQGFNNVVDLSRDGNQKYFIQDTIHLGWNGWLAFDQHVNPFLSHKQKAPNYKMNNQFFDSKWANYEPKANDSFKQFK